jgi:hypothetical protein
VSQVRESRQAAAEEKGVGRIGVRCWALAPSRAPAHDTWPPFLLAFLLNARHVVPADHLPHS